MPGQLPRKASPGSLQRGEQGEGNCCCLQRGFFTLFVNMSPKPAHPPGFGLGKAGGGGGEAEFRCGIYYRNKIFKKSGGCPGTQAVAVRADPDPSRGRSPGGGQVKPAAAPPTRTAGLCLGRCSPGSPCLVLPLYPGAVRPLCSPAPLPAAKDPGKYPTGVLVGCFVFFFPSPKGCSGAPFSKSRFCQVGGTWPVPGQRENSVGRDQRDKSPLLHQGPSPTYLPPTLPRGRYLSRSVPPGRSPSLPGDDAGLSPLSRGILALSILPRHLLLLPHPSPRETAASCVDGFATHRSSLSPAWQVIRQKGWWLLGTPMLRTPGTHAGTPSSPGTG